MNFGLLNPAELVEASEAELSLARLNLFNLGGPK
jgi:hypothetical protein